MKAVVDGQSLNFCSELLATGKSGAGTTLGRNSLHFGWLSALNLCPNDHKTSRDESSFLVFLGYQNQTVHKTLEAQQISMPPIGHVLMDPLAIGLK
jgi:hypothetical protein